jgi:hypothetical protein
MTAPATDPAPAPELATPDPWAEVHAALEARGITPEEPTGPDPLVAQLDRLTADRAEHPDSPTLTELAVLDSEGRAVGMSHRGSPLEIAYTSGAPASEIVKAERLEAQVGQPGDRGYLRRAIRLAHAIRAMNRRLSRYSGLRRSLPTVTLRGWAPYGLRRLEAVAVALAAAERAARWSTSTTGHGPPRSGADPPPIDPADFFPVLRTGPPATPLVRPRQAAPGAPARRTPERWTVSRAA